MTGNGNERNTCKLIVCLLRTLQPITIQGRRKRKRGAAASLPLPDFAGIERKTDFWTFRLTSQVGQFSYYLLNLSKEKKKKAVGFSRKNCFKKNLMHHFQLRPMYQVHLIFQKLGFFREIPQILQM